MKIGVIVQARMGSTRLPGKVLKDIAGQPMLWHVIDRLKHSNEVNEIIIATTINDRDDVLQKITKETNVSFFRGAEEDVLKRYVDASERFEIEMIVRITSDCPLIDPGTVDRLIQSHIEKKADYSSNTIERSFPRGLDSEIFSRELLEYADQHSKAPYQREHVTPYFYENPTKFKLNNLFAEEELNYPEFRLSVDTPEDLRLMEELYERLYNPPGIIEITKVINLLKNDPELRSINMGVEQKDLRN
jgi:spore coat polysaccharide biosynthesis protein SpsF